MNKYINYIKEYEKDFSYEKFEIFKEKISSKILQELKNNEESKESKSLESGKISQFSYAYIKDQNFNKVGILKVEYIQDNSQEEEELSSFLNRLFVVYIAMFCLAVVFAYFLSSYITRSLKSISEKIQETKLFAKCYLKSPVGPSETICEIVNR